MNQTVFLPQSIAAYNSLQKIPTDHLNIMGSVNDSQFYGLDSWAIVLVQGCFQKFQGCVDPQTWSFEINKLVSVEKLAAKVLSHPCNKGVIISGGEPFWQARSLVKFARIVKDRGLFVISFTGFTLEKLASPTAPLGARELIDWLDVLIAGPYIPSLAIPTPDSPLSSRNQRVHIFNSALKDKINWGSLQEETTSLETRSPNSPV